MAARARHTLGCACAFHFGVLWRISFCVRMRISFRASHAYLTLISVHARISFWERNRTKFRPNFFHINLYKSEFRKVFGGSTMGFQWVSVGFGAFRWTSVSNYVCYCELQRSVPNIFL